MVCPSKVLIQLQSLTAQSFRVVSADAVRTHWEGDGVERLRAGRKWEGREAEREGRGRGMESEGRGIEEWEGREEGGRVGGDTGTN